MPTVSELKAKLTKLGLSTSGAKSELEARLAGATKGGSDKRKKADEAEQADLAPKKARASTPVNAQKEKADALDKAGAAAVAPSAADASMSSSSLEGMLGSHWSPVLAEFVRSQPDYEKFLGNDRSKTILPLRELTFRALASNDPKNFKVIVFGEAPYPRMESATGIALFDGKFRDWQKLGTCVSLREMFKSACMWKCKIPLKSKAEDVRDVMAKNNVVQVTEWFQSTLVQGCLWLNTSLTTGGDLSKGQHQKFWKPIIRKIIEEILSSKKVGKQGCVFALWGKPSQALRPMLEEIAASAKVPVKFTEGWNPAASAYGPADFCENDNYGDINKGLKALGLPEIDWLPSVGWDSKMNSTKGAKKASGSNDVSRMGDFLQETLDLHKFFLERLGEVSKEGGKKLQEISGIAELPLQSLELATKTITTIPNLSTLVRQSSERVRIGRSKLTQDQAAALYLYTMQSSFYQLINAALREADRTTILPFFSYLRLLFSALEVLQPVLLDLWRGVKLDLRSTYVVSTTVTWWGISSCTPKQSVAQGFMGATGSRTLFKIEPKSATSIMAFSAFTEEEEYILPPGTQLFVKSSTTDKSGLTTVVLQEVEGKLVR
jgi:uracil DNA glycosylase